MPASLTAAAVAAAAVAIAAAVAATAIALATVALAAAAAAAVAAAAVAAAASVSLAAVSLAAVAAAIVAIVAAVVTVAAVSLAPLSSVAATALALAAARVHRRHTSCVCQRSEIPGLLHMQEGSVFKKIALHRLVHWCGRTFPCQWLLQAVMRRRGPRLRQPTLLSLTLARYNGIGSISPTPRMLD